MYVCAQLHVEAALSPKQVCGTQKDVYAPEVGQGVCRRDESVASARNQKQCSQFPTHSSATASTTSSSLCIMSARLRSTCYITGVAMSLWHHIEWNMKTGRTLCDKRPYKPLPMKRLWLLNMLVPQRKIKLRPFLSCRVDNESGVL
jgi:hypothetical protein